MGLPKLVASWLSATLAVVAAAGLGSIAPIFAIWLLGADETEQTAPTLAAASAFFAALCGVGMAYAGAPRRGLLFATTAFALIVFGAGVSWRALPPQGSPNSLSLGSLCLWSAAGGASALGLCIVREYLRGVVPNKPLQPTSGGHARDGSGSMGDAARG